MCAFYIGIMFYIIESTTPTPSSTINVVPGNSTNNHEGRLSGGAIAGIVIGCVAFVIIVVVIVIVILVLLKKIRLPCLKRSENETAPADRTNGKCLTFLVSKPMLSTNFRSYER